MASAMVLLPDPDLPTTASVWRWARTSETSASAVTSPPGVR